MTTMRINLVLVGGFVLASLVSLVAALMILAGRGGATDAYYTIYSNVAGLKYGSQVFYEGYPIGQVEKIEPVSEGGRMRFRVQMSVTHGWKIPEDSVARSVVTSFLAPQEIAISAGKSPSALQPGSMIHPGGPGGLMESLSGVATTMGDFTEQSLVPLATNLNREVQQIGDILDHQVRPIVGSANTVMAAAAQHVPRILQHIDSASSDFAAASAHLNSALDPQRVAALDRIIDNADSTAQNLQLSSAELRTLLHGSGDDLRVGLADFRTSMSAFASRADVISDNLANASRNFEEFSRSVRGNPSLLLRGSAPPDNAAPDPLLTGAAP
jgi:phospholipid/cholesterol/gamma-HCH transport system substrate-binding protein